MADSAPKQVFVPKKRTFKAKGKQRQEMPYIMKRKSKAS